MRADPLPGRAVRLPVADRRRPVADRRRLRGGGAHARPRSARRCTAATSSRSRSASSRCGCWRRCSATTPRSARRPRTSSRPATAGRRRRRSACSRCARGGDREAELGAAERARLGLALDQFRRTLPRRHALSTVHGRPRRAASSALVASAAGIAELARRAQEALDAAFADEGRRDASATAASTSTCATPTAPTSTPGSRCASPARCPSTAHPLVGRVSAPTGCWPAPPRRRTPAS